MRLVLYQPDIPQNAGAILRLAACMGVGVDVVEPCGFVLDDRRLKRAGMDYLNLATYVRHDSWEAFTRERAPNETDGRLVLLTTRADTTYDRFVFRRDDSLVLGRESAGVPDNVHRMADARVRVPLAAGARSLNVAVCAAMVLGEALRQTGMLPNTTVAEDAST